MLKHFLAVMLLLVMGVSVYSQNIPSGTGRYTALGSSPFMLDASTDIFNNPAWNNMYRDYAFGDLNQFGETDDFDGNAGVTFGVGKKWNLGIIVNRRQDSWNMFNSDSTYRPANSPIVPMMLLVGTSFNKNFHFGIAPYVSMGKVESTDTTGNVTNTNKSTSLGANVGFIYMVKKGWIEGSLMFRMNSFKNEASSTGNSAVVENDGGMEFGAMFRAWLFPKKGSKVAIVPVLGFHTWSFNPKGSFTTGGTTTSVTGMKHSMMSINAGVGLNWPVMDDIQLAGGITATYMTSKSDSGSVELKRTDFIAPGFNMALETRIADWLTGRMGFNKSIDMMKSETNTSTFSLNQPNTAASTVSLGAGFHFGRFSIDATVSERWLKQGVYFISGGNNQTDRDMFGVISASYNFAK
ncbi:MAG: hypothetical protein IT280_02570 [Ignavibacteria bacterium]|nr:hypothetical protein [Ignavibacteria bacterium]